MSTETEAHSMQAPIQQLLPDLTTLSLLHRPQQSSIHGHNMQPTGTYKICHHWNFALGSFNLK